MNKATTSIFVHTAALCSQMSLTLSLPPSPLTPLPQPGNRCVKYLIPYLESDEGKALSLEDLATFYGCVRTGIENPDSGLGCYAQTPADYTKFAGFFEKVSTR